MAKTRILLTGASGLTGLHILSQLLSERTVSVRAVVESREAAFTLQQQQPRSSDSPLDLAVISEQDLTLPGIFEDALTDHSDPFHAVVYTLPACPPEEADCLARYINLETETVINFLRLVREVAPSVSRVVIVTSLTPFAKWLVDPQAERNIPGAAERPMSPVVLDSEYIMAASQASDNIVYDAVSQWVRESGVPFDVVYITAPSIYGPTVLPLETSSDLLEANRRVWDICSNESRERLETPPYGIAHFLDARDLAAASVRAIFTPRAANKRFFISAGTMFNGSEIADYLVAQFPELRGRIHPAGPVSRHPPPDDPPLSPLDSYMTSTILGISQYYSRETTLADITRQILDLQRRKSWKSIIQS